MLQFELQHVFKLIYFSLLLLFLTIIVLKMSSYYVVFFFTVYIVLYYTERISTLLLNQSVKAYIITDYINFRLARCDECRILLFSENLSLHPICVFERDANCQ